jgi:hypothetical protein
MGSKLRMKSSSTVILASLVAIAVAVGIFVSTGNEAIAPTPIPEDEHPEACVDLYAPVCGIDGKTYSNECYARMTGVPIAHEGECAN